jgi:hypothetical protein
MQGKKVDAGPALTIYCVPISDGQKHVYVGREGVIENTYDCDRESCQSHDATECLVPFFILRHLGHEQEVGQK